METLNLSCAPENLSLLNPAEFRFIVHKAPYLSFFTQTVALPTIELPPVNSENPFTDVPTPGDHINWDQLSVVFIVDEDLRGYQEIFNWIRGMGFPNSYAEYRALLEQWNGYDRFDDVTSGISVFTNTGSRNANIEFIFEDAFPVSLAPPTLSTNTEGITTATSKARFAYTSFSVRRVGV